MRKVVANLEQYLTTQERIAILKEGIKELASKRGVESYELCLHAEGTDDYHSFGKEYGHIALSIFEDLFHEGKSYV